MIDLLLKLVAISHSLFNFLAEVFLVFDPLVTVTNEFLGQFLYLFGFLFQLLDGFIFNPYHLLEVVTLEYQIRNGLFIMSLIASANLDQDI